MENIEVTAPSRAEALDIRYLPTEGTYEITLPGFTTGVLETQYLNGTAGQIASSTGNHVRTGPGSLLADVLVTLPVPGSSQSKFTYTSFGSWEASTADTSSTPYLVTQGIFAYGIPTAPGDVPTTGSASYFANVMGATATGNYVGGDARLLFDFAAGTLSGSMHPLMSDGWDLSIDPGQYTFAQTVFSAGSTSFAGSFVVPGMPNASSFFEGSFNGPKAAELMARWQAPYQIDGAEGSMFGIWIGKKD